MDGLREFRKVNNEPLLVAQSFDPDWLQHASTVGKNEDGMRSVIVESEQRYIREQSKVSPLLASLINRI